MTTFLNENQTVASAVGVTSYFQTRDTTHINFYKLIKNKVLPPPPRISHTWYISLLSLLLLLFPLSTQTSSFSLSLDLDSFRRRSGSLIARCLSQSRCFHSDLWHRYCGLQAISPCALNSIPLRLLTMDSSGQISYRAPLRLLEKTLQISG